MRFVSLPGNAIRRWEREKKIKKMRADLRRQKYFRKAAKYTAIVGALLFALIYLSACGQEYQPKKPGFYGETAAVEKLIAAGLPSRFEKLKSCGGFQAGDFEELAITAIPTTFACNGVPRIGCFYPSNIILISIEHDYLIPWLFIHESLHYLLDVNEGHPFRYHGSQLFIDCT